MLCSVIERHEPTSTNYHALSPPGKQDGDLKQRPDPEDTHHSGIVTFAVSFREQVEGWHFLRVFFTFLDYRADGKNWHPVELRAGGGK